MLTTDPAASTDLPTVDVVVATRNRPDLLRIALDSIWEQTYAGDIVVHVVFDRCEIDPLALREGPRRRVVALNNDRAPGLAGARNSGILHGSGALVAFCDDDDSWRPTKVHKQVQALRGSSALTAVTGITVQYSDTATDRVPSPEDMTLAQLVRDRVMEAHPSTVMVRRDALVGPIGLVDEKLPGSYAEDFDWIIRAAQAGSFAVVQEPLVTVLWGQSMFSQRWRTIIEAIDYLISKHQVFSEDPRAAARLYGRRAFALAALGERREAMAEAARTLRLNPRERRALMATAVASRVISAERLMGIAHRRGHGI